MTLRLLVPRALWPVGGTPLRWGYSTAAGREQARQGRWSRRWRSWRTAVWVVIGTDRTRRNNDLRSPLLSSVSPFLLFNQLGLSIDISWPISFGLVNSFTWIYYYVLVLTDNDSLRTRLLTHVPSTCVHTDKCIISIQSCRYLIG